jgi:hypothetical protein
MAEGKQRGSHADREDMHASEWLGMRDDGVLSVHERWCQRECILTAGPPQLLPRAPLASRPRPCARRLPTARSTVQELRQRKGSRAAGGSCGEEKEQGRSGSHDQRAQAEASVGKGCCRACSMDRLRSIVRVAALRTSLHRPCCSVDEGSVPRPHSATPVHRTARHPPTASRWDAANR